MVTRERDLVSCDSENLSYATPSLDDALLAFCVAVAWIQHDGRRDSTEK
jgi:hypothetical protein